MKKKDQAIFFYTYMSVPLEEFGLEAAQNLAAKKLLIITVARQI